MNRRSFLGTMIGGIAASAAVRTWPFRIYSFPSFDSKKYTLAELLAPGLQKVFQVYLSPGGAFIDGDGTVLLNNNTEKGALIYKPLFAKGNWKCEDGVVIIEGTNA